MGGGRRRGATATAAIAALGVVFRGGGSRGLLAVHELLRCNVVAFLLLPSAGALQSCGMCDRPVISYWMLSPQRSRHDMSHNPPCVPPTKPVCCVKVEVFELTAE